MEPLLVRRKTYDKFWMTSHSQKTGFTSPYSCKWSNTMYLHFEKSDFPNLNLPIYEDGRFNYMDEHDLHNLPFHGGITFYEETKHLESGRTFVKVGCDYQHLFDEQSYGQDDFGEEILRTDGERVAESFKKLVGIE